MTGRTKEAELTSGETQSDTSVVSGPKPRKWAALVGIICWRLTTNVPDFIAKPRIAGPASISIDQPVTARVTPAQSLRMAAADARAAKAAKRQPQRRTTLRTQWAAVRAGARAYTRSDDGCLMVELTPHNFVAHHVSANDNKPGAVAA